MSLARLWLLIALLATVTWPISVEAQSQPINSAQPAAGRDTVVIGVWRDQEPDNLNPLVAENADFADLVLRTIRTIDVERDANGKLVAQGVEDLPSLKDGTWKADGERMTLIWRLKRRQWHDGRPVTCGDYVFTHTVMRNEQVPIPGIIRRTLPKRIGNLSCPKGASGREIVVNWKERWAYAHLWIVGGIPALPRHILEPDYRANPARLNQVPYGSDPRATIGDGPYRLVEWRRGESITVEAMPSHPIFGTSKIRRITLRYLPRDDLAANLRSGAVDAIRAITIDQALELDKTAARHIKVFFEPGLIWEHIDFNLDNPLLQDIRVRRAIAHGINRTQIVQQLFQGRQSVSHTYLTPKHPGYTEAVQKYAHAPARAQALLREAGFAPGSDGIMQRASGQRLSLELSTTAGNRVREQVEQIIQQQLLQVGIEIIIRNFPPRVFFGEMTGRRGFKALVIYAWVWSPTTDCDQFYTSDGIPQESNGWRGGNFSGYRNPEMDRVCKAITQEINEDRRKALLQDSARIFSRDLPALPLFVRVDAAAAKIGLQNFRPTGTETPETWSAHTWYWR